MKILNIAKDGGPESNVTGYWLVESKRFFSIVLLKFDKGSREAAAARNKAEIEIYAK